MRIEQLFDWMRNSVSHRPAGAGYSPNLPPRGGGGALPRRGFGRTGTGGSPHAARWRGPDTAPRGRDHELLLRGV